MLGNEGYIGVMREKNPGNVLAEYGIIAVLVAIVAIPAVISLSQTVVGNLQTYLNAFASNTTNVRNNAYLNSHFDHQEKVQKVIENSLASTDFTKDCNGSSCTISVGNYVLEGIPENFNAFVETSGASGGTDKIVSLLNQISDQLVLDS